MSNIILIIYVKLSVRGVSVTKYDTTHCIVQAYCKYIVIFLSLQKNREIAELEAILDENCNEMSEETVATPGDKYSTDEMEGD